MLLSVAEALEQILTRANPIPPREIVVSAATGLLLAEDIASDVDSPPHDKSVVDGYALRSADIKEGRAELIVLEEILAGAVPTRPITPGHTSRIMTGAPIPDGADSVVMIERTQLVSAGGNAGSPPKNSATTHLGAVHIDDPNFRAGQNIMPRAKSLRKGDLVLRTGAELGPAEIGLLSEVGRTKIHAVGPVLISILSTGNELVPADVVPGPAQIRNSNGPLLSAACRREGAMPLDLGIARDDAADLHRLIGAALHANIVILSGGVSAGVLDLVPGVLAELGVKQVFHKINLKPGKPLWFGTFENTSHVPPTNTLVFALPGNPVSSLVCFTLFVKPAIAQLAGRKLESPHPTMQAHLSRDFSHRGDRPTYHPALLGPGPFGPTVDPTIWQGSADLRGLVGANALAIFPPGDRTYHTGDVIEVMLMM